MSMQSCRETQGNKKKIAVENLRSASRGNFGDKAPSSRAVLLQYSQPDVARRTAIALIAD